jgi:hypothetical protein
VREKKGREKEKRDKEFLLLGCKRKREERPNFSGVHQLFISPLA